VKPVLVVNSGSSSLKYQLIDVDSSTARSSGLIERVTNHSDAFAQMLDELGDVTPVAVGHRVVHGGAAFNSATLITDEVLVQIEELSSLAPLHNPGNAAGIRGAIEAFPGVTQVAVFDTAFHQTMPASSYRYAIDKNLADKFGVRRYGFHGTSFSYVTKRTAEHLGKQAHELNAIILHLGNGASVCAVKNGKSFDTSMGLTPLQGLVMGSRSGDIDPAIIPYLARVANMSMAEIDDTLNKHSGLLGMTGASDLRDVEAKAASGDIEAVEAIEVYVQRIKHYIGAYLAELGGVDALVFTAGVGENSTHIRAKVLERLGSLGFEIDGTKNEQRSKDARSIAAENSRAEILVIPTNEELEIALQAAVFVN